MRAAGARRGSKRSAGRQSPAAAARSAAIPGAEPRQVRGAKGGRLGLRRALHGKAEDVREPLAEPAVAGHAAVDTKGGRRRGAVGLHRGEQIGGLETDGVERSAGEVGRPGVASQTENGTARVGIPMGRAEAGEGGDHGHRSFPGASGKQLAVRGVAEEAQAVGQPLHGGAGVEDRAFERIDGAAREPPGKRRQKALA